MPSYEQNKSSKLWSVRFRELDDTGISHNKRLSGYKTKKEAQYAYQDYLNQKAEEEAAKAAIRPDSPDDIYFEVLASQFLKYKEGRVKHSTLCDLKSRVTSKLLPFFKGKRMCDIKPLDILDWQKKELAGKSYNYSCKLMQTLGAIYQYGDKYHDVTNIMSKVDRPRNMSPKKEMLFWTPEEFGKFYAAAEDTTYRLFFLTLYVTGCRRGECQALTWNDFDPVLGKLKISKSITKKTEKNKAWDVTTPKNEGSNRTVSVPTFLCEQLTEYKKEQTVPSSDFIFGGARPLPPTSIDRYFKATAEKAGVNIIRVHDLRHSCASLLISKGVSIVGVSRHLGHTDVEQTLNTYAHLMPDDQIKIAGELEQIGFLLSDKNRP